MKVEFELSIDKIGCPIIKIRHHDKSSDVEQKLMGVFIDRARSKGIKLVGIGGYLECGTSNSHEDYEIRINDEP